MGSKPITTAKALYIEMQNESPLSPRIHAIPVNIERWLYIEAWNCFEHDFALMAGVALRRDTAMHMRTTLPRTPDMNEAMNYYREIEQADTEWFNETVKPGQDVVTVVVPIPHHLLAILDKWEHWDLVELGRYMELVIRQFHTALGDDELTGIRAEWEATYPEAL